MLDCTKAPMSPCAAKSSVQAVRAKNPRASAWGSGLTRKAPASGRASKRMGSERVQAWDGRDEAPAPIADGRHLGGDLVLQVPGQDEEVVRPKRQQSFGRDHRDA